MPKISIIAAVSDNNALGANNDLLWHIPHDLKRFKEITKNHTVIMGNNTYLSLQVKPLPYRRNIVISRNKNNSYTGCIMARSVEEAINYMDIDKENFILGGGVIYNLFMPFTDKMYLTVVHKEYNADVYFPDIIYPDWDVVFKEEHRQEQPEPLDFTYITLQKKISK